jgi:hypothetical protein
MGNITDSIVPRCRVPLKNDIRFIRVLVISDTIDMPGWSLVVFVVVGAVMPW